MLVPEQSMFSMASQVALLLSISPLIVATSATTIPRALAWSSKTYGPDGPWHAITLQVGTPPQQLDLFPGGFWQSNILSSSICASSQSLTTQPCYASLAGLYDSSKSSTQISVSETGDVQNSTFEDKGVLSLFGSANYVFDAMSIVTEDPPSASVQFQDFDMLAITKGSWTLPNGSLYPIEVGNLALGAPEVNQSWNDGTSRFNSSLVPSSLYLQGQTPSNSFGMHIGSIAMSIPPSLYLGGYDQSRVLGNVTVQDYNMHYFPIDLLDIGIGVAEGSSPFPFNSKTGLLSQGNSSIGVAMQVLIDPIAPYLYLPKSTCDAIAQYLPITYNQNLGLYFWDTTSATYSTITSSPSYLSFTFRLNSSVTQTTTINVPLSLLNLTLTAPLVNTPTQYFPCTPFSTGQSYGISTLGKAFLQAAFLGVNWGLEGSGVWFLAQAPGPNTPSQAIVKSIGLNDEFITSSTNEWAETWKGSWTVLDNGPVGGNSTASGAPSGSETLVKLSTGALVGIAVGAVVGLGLGIIGFVLCLRKRKRKVAKKSREDSADEQNRWYRAEMEAESKLPWELAEDPVETRSELDSSRRPMELPA